MLLTLILRETGHFVRAMSAAATHTSELQCKSKEFWTLRVRTCYETALASPRPFQVERGRSCPYFPVSWKS
jgi:hypothetical protein